MRYQIKSTDELTENEIEHILQLWDIDIWNKMKTDYFRTFFKDSNFISCWMPVKTYWPCSGLILILLWRFLGKGFLLQKQSVWFLLTGKKGYGAQLVRHFRDHVTLQKMETIGFCHQELRPFYEKCNIEIVYDKAKMIKESIGSEWINSEDDDILIFNVSGREKNC